VRSLLFQPWDRSRPLSWVLVVFVAVIAVVSGLVIHDFVSAPKRPAPWSPPGMRLASSNRPGLRVLFIGNSFTAQNSLVAMVTQMAETNRSRPRPVFAVEYDPGGSKLEDAAASPDLARVLAGARWNVVVLQEQSQGPAVPDWYPTHTIPALASLTTRIRRDGATPLLFETWGYRDGDQVNGSNNYAMMQASLQDGYAQIASSQHIGVAPVGDAWAMALGQQPSLPLWASDGHHPSLEGSYLAAAVLTTMLDTYDPHPNSGIDARNTAYTAGLDPSAAASLRQIAFDTVAQPTTLWCWDASQLGGHPGSC
jgi:hypothetical protein